MSTAERVIAGRYRLGRRLGVGGMAVVYLAFDPQLSREVAIKLPRVDDVEPADLERFRSELRAVGRLNHPNIVTVYDGGEADGQPFLVMQAVLGETLAELIEREAPIPAPRAAEIGRQVADALAYAHSLGIVHRDVKPRNVLLDERGQVKVTDFGIARGSGEATRTRAGTVMGTPSYIAPEVTAGQPATVLSDVYAVGVLLYCLLTGHTPFESENPIAEAVRSQQEDALPPSCLAPVPAWLDAVVLRALAREPARRVPSAAALARDLALGHAAPELVQPALIPGTDATRAFALPRMESTQAPPVPPAERQRVHVLRGLGLAVALGALAGAALFAFQSLPRLRSVVAASPTPAATQTTPAPHGNLLASAGLTAEGNQPPSSWHEQRFQGLMDPSRGYFWSSVGGPAEVGLKAAPSGMDAAWMGPAVPVQPAWKLEFTAQVKVADVPAGGPGAALHVACAGAGGRQLGVARSAPLTGSTGWTSVQLAFNVPASADSCTPQLWLGDAGKPTTGTVEFRQVALQAA